MRLRFLKANAEQVVSRNINWKSGCPVIIHKAGLTFPSGIVERIRANKAIVATTQQEIYEIAWDLHAMKSHEAVLPTIEELMSGKYILGRLSSAYPDILVRTIVKNEIVLEHPFISSSSAKMITVILRDGMVVEDALIASFSVITNQELAKSEFLKSLSPKVVIPGIYPPTVNVVKE